MSKLKLSVAVGNYDRVRPLMDGAVKTAERNCPYVGVPAFVSRAFRHNSIYVRKDRVKSPADLKGRRVGLPEYQLTACVWARIILEDDHGVKPSDMVWVRGGIEHPGRPEKIAIKLPPGVRMEDAPSGVTISELLERGDIDGFIAPRVPSLAGKKNPHIGWLFPDPIAAGGGAQGVRASQGQVPRGARRHRREQGDAALRRGSAARRARVHGQRLLVLWACGQPQGAGDLPASPLCAGPFVATGVAGRAVPSLDPRKLCDLGRSQRGRHFFSVPRSMAAVATAE